MQVIVNGDGTEVPEAATVLELLEQLGLAAETVVVQRNDDIVERDRFGATPLAAGDTVEVVRLVGGG